ncbi:MAG: flagellar protein FlgN [Sulfuritalea sp.]|nr:flagellar protein FlgN [Sulfuritalea sp.]
MTAIAALLEQSIAELQDFLAAIAAERHSLVKGDINQLPAIAEKKSALAIRLAGLEAKRDAALGAGGFGVGREGAAAWLAANPAASRQGAHNAWQHYVDQAAEAKRENEINGKLIAARLQQNHQALAALLGETSDAGTYGADGQRRAKSGSRPLGSA